MKRIIIIVVYVTASLVANAQDLNIIRDLMNVGQYGDALEMLEGLNVVHGYKYSDDIEKIGRIRNLYNDALSYFTKGNYSSAITNYEQIIEIYSTLSFDVDSSFIKGKISICKNAITEYEKELQEKLLAEEKERAKQDSIRQVKAQARQIWEKTLRTNTLLGYISYLNKYPDGKYVAEAKNKLFQLFIASAKDEYYKGNYREAVNQFYEAGLYGKLSSGDDYWYKLAMDKMAKQQEEEDYKSLMTVSFPLPSRLEAFLKNYPNSKYAAVIRGELIEGYCRIGRFDDARGVIEDSPNNIIYLNEEFAHDLDWWMKYVKIRERKSEREFKKNSKKQEHRFKNSNVGTMLSLGGTISFAKNPNGAAFVGPRLAFSIGAVYNTFNLEVSISGMFQRPDNVFEIQLPLAIAPRWNINIIRDDFNLYLQPEIGYDILHKGLFYAGRAGFGGGWGSIYFGVAYNQKAVDKVQIQVGYVWSWMWNL